MCACPHPRSLINLGHLINARLQQTHVSISHQSILLKFIQHLKCHASVDKTHSVIHTAHTCSHQTIQNFYMRLQLSLLLMISAIPLIGRTFMNVF